MKLVYTEQRMPLVRIEQAERLEEAASSGPVEGGECLEELRGEVERAIRVGYRAPRARPGRPAGARRG